VSFLLSLSDEFWLFFELIETEMLSTQLSFSKGRLSIPFLIWGILLWFL